MSKPSLRSPSQTTTTKQSLQAISQILHLTHHRNKNQHRLAKWWKQFSVLRRNFSKLLSEIEVLETAERFSEGGNGKGEKYVRDAKLVVERRVEFLECWVLERAFVAFSNVVKDLQYSSLGLMLLATLAEIKAVIRPLGKELVVEEEEDDDEVVAVVKHIEPSREDENMQDLGEVVSREELETVPLEDQAEEEETLVRKKLSKVKQAKSEPVAELEAGSESRLKKRSKEDKKKKKRKRGDAFDDLFDSLI